MEVIVSKRFFKELKKCPPGIQRQTQNILKIAASAKDLDEIPDLKKLSGYKDYYRVRVGQYRIGFQFDQQVIRILYVLTIQSRGNIYKTFPPK